MTNGAWRSLATALALGVLGSLGCFEDNDPASMQVETDTESDTGRDWDTDTETDTETDTSPPPTWPEVEWGECPEYIEVSPDLRAQCAHVGLPIDHLDSDLGTIPVFVYRVPATASPKRGQLWFLQGGPGGSGADFAAIFDVYRAALPEWDLYSLDHRGVGNSARLSCAAEEAMEELGYFDYDACARELSEEWGSALPEFNVTNAARDLGVLIEATAAPSDEVVVYGVSYGTYWAERFMQVHPTLADAVVLDSICPPGGCKIDEYDRNFDLNGKKLLDVCADDPTCGARFDELGLTPRQATAALFKALDDHTVCEPLLDIDRATTRLVLAFLTIDSFLRVPIAPIIYRALRCNDEDKAALENVVLMVGMLLGFEARLEPDDYLDEPEVLASDLTLGNHIILAELLGDLTLAEVESIDEAAWFSPEGSRQPVEIRDSGKWPIYSRDSYYGEASDTGIPILMLNGDLDPQTPIEVALPAKDLHDKPHQTFVTVRWSPHGVLFASLMPENVNDILSDDRSYMTRTCGFELLAQFLDDPTAPLDTSCADNTYPLELSSDGVFNRAAASIFFGVPDLWDGGPTTAVRGRMAPRLLNPAVSRAAQQLRQRWGTWDELGKWK